MWTKLPSSQRSVIEDRQSRGVRLLSDPSIDVRRVLLTLGAYAVIMMAWIGAWLLHNLVGLTSQSEALDTLYWTGAKLLIWLVPMLLIVRVWIARPVAQYLSLRRWRGGVTTGLTVGVAFVGLAMARDGFALKLALPSVGAGLVNALMIAPIFEELLFRGFLLTSLQEAQAPFWIANGMTALLFLGLHLPGWYFIGSANLSHVMAMVGILLVGLGAGLAKQWSHSLWGSITFHAVNNISSAFLT